jgi:hypothetical protein
VATSESGEQANQAATPEYYFGLLQECRAALRDALELLRDLRDYPLADLERRQEEIDTIVAVVERALGPTV